MKKFKTIFLGNSEFSIPALEVLNSHPKVDLLWAIGGLDKKRGRGPKTSPPATVEFCQARGVPSFQTANINQEVALLEQLQTRHLDLIVVLSFGQFLSPQVLSLPRLGPYNIHASLLPRYRGAAPIERAIWAGEATTGVSIQRMVSQLDAGDVVWSQEVPIRPHETGGSLRARLKFLGALALENFLEALAANTLTPRAQDDSLVCWAPKLSREDGLLDFAQESATDIERKVRALCPRPGAYCFLRGKRIKIFAVTPEATRPAPGQVSTDLGILLVGAKDGGLRLVEVQLEGKKRMSDSELIRGRLL